MHVTMHSASERLSRRTLLQGAPATGLGAAATALLGGQGPIARAAAQAVD